MNLLLVTAFITNGLRYTTANLLAAMGRIRVNMIVSFGGMVSQILLNLALIPLFGMYGAAYTSIISYSFMAVAVFVPFVKMYRVH
ncbi:polysaccharide biosynthesis C-terminal domain-containing protein [Eggerthella timonensis]|uniref:polysaccharide biosynthesis C-terminal domain-containing protein n=1 Tax=Eggerthella timonensis TaxID=1871008 RepID=UPI003CCC3174